MIIISSVNKYFYCSSECGASFAAKYSVSEVLLKKHGRWKTDFAKDGYIRETDEIKRSVSLNLGI